MKRFLNIIIIFLLIYSHVLAQDQTTEGEEETIKQAKKEQRAAKKAEKIEMGKFMISPLAAPGYTPELGALFAIGGLASFKTTPSDQTLQRSSLPFTLAYTTTGAFTANAILTSYWFGDKFRMNVDLWYKDMPDNYWGVGYDNGVNVTVSDSTTAYNRQWFLINPRLLWQFRQNYFVGLILDVNYTKGTEASQGVMEDPFYELYNDMPLNTGLGLILRYDSRDLPVNAWKGMLVDLRATFYSTAFGGDNTYQIYLLDLRKYQQILRRGSTLAFQIKSRVGIGEVPYGEMSQIGTPYDLRGYTWGRFRDRSMLYFLGEWRHVFEKKNEELSKHGAVLWVGAGTIFEQTDLDETNMKWLPNFGFGYRFEVQPRMNIRLDVGVGRETYGIYFNFVEAF